MWVRWTKNTDTPAFTKTKASRGTRFVVMFLYHSDIYICWKNLNERTDGYLNSFCYTFQEILRTQHLMDLLWEILHLYSVLLAQTVKIAVLLHLQSAPHQWHVKVRSFIFPPVTVAIVSKTLYYGLNYRLYYLIPGAAASSDALVEGAYMYYIFSTLMMITCVLQCILFHLRSSKHILVVTVFHWYKCDIMLI